MDQSIASPYTDDKVLGRVAKFMRLIASAGITPEVMQLLINDAPIRRRFTAELQRLVVEVQKPLVEWDFNDPDLFALFKMLADAHPQRAYQARRCEENWRSRGAVMALLLSLRNDRARIIAVRFYGLDGRKLTVKELAEMLQVSETVIRSQIQTILRDVGWFADFYSMSTVTRQELDFLYLGLSTRTLRMLWRGGILDIDALTSRTADQLLAMNTSFGKKSLREVEQALALRSLHLAE